VLAAALVVAAAEVEEPALDVVELDEQPATVSAAAMPTDMVARMRRFICIPLSREVMVGEGVPAHQRVRDAIGLDQSGDWHRPLGHVKDANALDSDRYTSATSTSSGWPGGGPCPDAYRSPCVRRRCDGEGCTDENPEKGHPP
jgi:hypothetical protein